MSKVSSKTEKMLLDYGQTVSELSAHYGTFSPYLMLMSRLAGICATHSDIRENHFFRQDLEAIPVLIEFFGRLTQLYHDVHRQPVQLSDEELREAMRLMKRPALD
jgi:hypothetical protein